MAGDPAPAVARSAPSYVRTPAAPFLGSLPVDRPLARYDLAGSLAHVEALGAAGVLSATEVRTLSTGLRTIGREVADGSFRWRAELEDVHTNVETRLTELVGPLGGMLQAGRSRNDQVALDERLYLRAAVAQVAAALIDLQEALLERADADASTPMPGYTHLQRAQLVTVGHHLLAHYWRFDRDLDRLFATVERAETSPLGAGALAGSTLPLEPEATAHRLGFRGAFENSLDAVSDRDPFAELLFDLALLAVHASGLGEEVVLFASKEFGFLERSEALGSGSSLMPQKRNPDVAELVRARTGRAVGDLVALLTALKGLPLAYDRDLQEDKGPVLDAVASVGGTVEALGRLVRALRFDRTRLAAAASDPELYATDLAETLVARGVPFREAHELVRSAVLARPAATLPGTLQAASPSGADVVELSTDPAAGLARRRVRGGPGPAAFRLQLDRARRQRDARHASLSSLVRKVEQIEELVNEGTT
ncbi:MAG TPA: argininosuccinate lyase [Thermoplasmata archaeon]|nr:argininosuccinate lyase [Thermoplasmata archaeon]